MLVISGPQSVAIQALARCEPTQALARCETTTSSPAVRPPSTHKAEAPQSMHIRGICNSAASRHSRIVRHQLLRHPDGSHNTARDTTYSHCPSCRLWTKSYSLAAKNTSNRTFNRREMYQKSANGSTPTQQTRHFSAPMIHTN